MKPGICASPQNSHFYKISPLIKYSDVYWKHCHYQPPLTLNCLSWKITVTLIFILILVFLTTPTILINFILTQSPFIKEVFGKTYDSSDFVPYFLTTFLPPLFILGINRLFYFVIFRSTQREKKIRLSRYHYKVAHVSFLYMIFNSLILPGIAIPSGANLITLLFGQHDVEIKTLLKNFYGYSNINFFVTIMI